MASSLSLCCCSARSLCVFIACFTLAGKESLLPGWRQHITVVTGKQHCSISGRYKICWFWRFPLVLLLQSLDTETEISFWSPFTLYFHVRGSWSLESSNIGMHTLSKICFSDAYMLNMLENQCIFFPGCFGSTTACKIHVHCFTYIFRWIRRDTIPSF